MGLDTRVEQLVHNENREGSIKPTREKRDSGQRLGCDIYTSKYAHERLVYIS